MASRFSVVSRRRTVTCQLSASSCPSLQIFWCNSRRAAAPPRWFTPSPDGIPDIRFADWIECHPPLDPVRQRPLDNTPAVNDGTFHTGEAAPKNQGPDFGAELDFWTSFARRGAGGSLPRPRPLRSDTHPPRDDGDGKRCTLHESKSKLEIYQKRLRFE
jgi:hypothetical protein